MLLNLSGIKNNITFTIKLNGLMKYILPLICVAFFLGTGCTKDNAEDLDTNPTCDTEGITYENTVKAIMNTHCISCHSAGGQTPNLTTYGGVKSSVDNGSFNQQVLVLKTMPPSGPLTTCQQNKLTQWIADGAPEN